MSKHNRKRRKFKSADMFITDATVKKDYDTLETRCEIAAEIWPKLQQDHPELRQFTLGEFMEACLFKLEIVVHEDEDGFRWLGFQPTSTTAHSNQDGVCLCFADEEAGAGVQIVLSHESFRDLMLFLAKARETIEADQEEE